MALQSFIISLGAFRDDQNNGDNYKTNQVIFIKKQSGGLASLYRDLGGTSPIVQDGFSNTTNEKGQFEFYVEAGQYNAEYNGELTPITVTGADFFNNEIASAVEQITIDTMSSRGFVVAGDFASGFTYDNYNQVGIDTEGGSWIYVGAGAPNKVVTAGTVPSAPDYKQVSFNAASGVSDSRGTNVQDFIDENLTPFKTVADMKAAAYLSTLPEFTRVEWQGYYAQSDGGSNWGVLRFGTHTEDGGSIFSIDANTYIEANLKGSNITPQKFGAKSEDQWDSAPAFQAAADYINSFTSGVETITLKGGTFSIGETVELGRANLHGNGFNRTRKGQILSLDGFTGALFSVRSAYIDNVTFSGRGKVATCLTYLIDGYNTQITRCEFGGFKTAIHLKGIPVNFTIDKSTLHNNITGFYCEDYLGQQSTTLYMSNTMFQFCHDAVLFEKEVFGASFENVIIENVSGSAFKANYWSNCKWESVWWENNQGASPRYIIESGQASGIFQCVAINIYPRSPWINNVNAVTSDESAGNKLTTWGGTTVDNAELTVGSSIGLRTIISTGRIHHDADAYVPSGADADLKVSTKNRAPISNIVRNIRIMPGDGGSFYVENNREDSLNSPVILNQVGGLTDENGNREYIRSQALDLRISNRSNHKRHPETTQETAIFDSPITIVFDSSSEHNAVSTAGYSLSVISEGVIRLVNPKSTGGIVLSKTFKDPNLSISGIFSGSFLLHRVTTLGSYSGSWSSYREALGFDIHFQDVSGTYITPDRFTIRVGHNTK